MACNCTLALVLVILAQVGLFFWALSATNVMKEEWPHVVKATPADAYVVQNEHFLGPVWAIIPRRCGEMDMWQQTVEEGKAEISAAGAAGSTAATGAGATLGEVNWEGLYVDSGGGLVRILQRGRTVIATNTVQSWSPATATVSGRTISLNNSTGTLSNGVISWSDGETWSLQASSTTVSAGSSPSWLGDQLEERRLVWTIKVSRCNQTMEFKGTTFWQRYFSMTTLGRVLYGEITDAQELHKVRIRIYNWIIAGILVSMSLKYTLKVTDIIAHFCGYQYEQIWNQGRTTFDKALESLLFHGSNIVFTLAMQMTMCCLFLSFWLDDHFVMLHVPGSGFALFVFSLVFFQGMMVLDRLMSWMARCNDWYIYVFWVTYVLWAVVVNIPMIGYCIYSVNFMWQVHQMGWLTTEEYIFSEAFVHASKSVARAMGSFLGVALVDMVVIIMLDLTHISE
mmetsp:Transcript_97923/g.178951  ORF Transcript_97923/g.178951 Transcript_97923/m.178951 type:complete len:453 (-) Transcript_97923:173-1531(-)